LTLILFIWKAEIRFLALEELQIQLSDVDAMSRL
jgi:hypothetical protein